MNSNMLRGLIYERKKNQAVFEREIGWHEGQVGRVLSGKRVLNINELYLFVDTLSMTPEEILAVFFDKEITVRR